MAFDIACDWLSFTLPIAAMGTLQDAKYQIGQILRDYPELELTGDVGPRRKRYDSSLKLGIGGVVFFSKTLDYILVEITGKGCRSLEDDGLFAIMAKNVLQDALNVTRFDLAVDIETDTLPVDFVEQRSKRWKSTSHVNTVSGLTEYVGSKTGDRYTKVYRYLPPHEREHLLRVETTTRKPLASEALWRYVEAIEAGQVTGFAASYNKPFMWSHPDWNFEDTARIKYWRPDTGGGATLRWIHQAVVPALERLYKNGVADNDHSIWTAIANVTPLMKVDNEDQYVPVDDGTRPVDDVDRGPPYGL